MMVILQKMISKKLLFTIFYATISCFSRVRFLIIPSTPKLVICFTSIFFTTCFVTQQVDETFSVSVKVIIDFKWRFGDKAKKKVSVTCILVHT